MKYIIVIIALLLVSCSVSSDVSVQNAKTNELTQWLPVGAKLIKTYNNQISSDPWIKWSFDGECFLSYHAGLSNGVITKVNCPQ